MKSPHKYAMTDTVEGKRECTFLTLFPAQISVQFTMILTCYEQRGWYPTHLIMHPQRYAVCDHTTLYYPIPQQRMAHVIQAQQEGGPIPMLDAILAIHLVPDTRNTLAWYQVRCTRSP